MPASIHVLPLTAEARRRFRAIIARASRLRRLEAAESWHDCTEVSVAELEAFVASMRREGYADALIDLR